MIPSILQGGSPDVTRFDVISATVLGFQKFSFSYELHFFIFFLSFSHVLWCSLSVLPSTCKFPFLQAFWLILDLAVLFLPLSVFVLLLLAWQILLCQIPFLHFNWRFFFILVSNSFSFFYKQLDFVNVHILSYHFLGISSFVGPCGFFTHEIDWRHCFFK